MATRSPASSPRPTRCCATRLVRSSSWPWVRRSSPLTTASRSGISLATSSIRSATLNVEVVTGPRSLVVLADRVDEAVHLLAVRRDQLAGLLALLEHQPDQPEAEVAGHRVAQPHDDADDPDPHQRGA